MRGGLVALVLLAASVLGAAGCKDLRYYDINVTYTGFTGVSTTSKIQVCHLTVSGAESADFYVGGAADNCGSYYNSAAPSKLGTIEYSSLADSGQLTFDMKVYNGIPEGATTQCGEGSKTITVGGMGADMTTNPLDLMVAAMGGGC